MFVERYRRIPGRLAFAMAGIASFGLAVIVGILGAIAAMYVYDPHDVTKGDGFVVGMGGLFAVGTFSFVFVFSWLRSLYHEISSRTPLFAWLICLPAPVATTASLWDNYDNYYANLVLAGWAGILFCGLAALVLCRRLLVHTRGERHVSVGE